MRTRSGENRPCVRKSDRNGPQRDSSSLDLDQTQTFNAVLPFATASGGREQSPLALDALEDATTALEEAQPRANYEILDGAGGQHLAGRRCRGDARGDVDGDPAYVVSHAHALARVESRAHFQAERTQGLTNGEPAPHPARRAVEQRQKAVPRRRDLAPTK